jgi:hypothetical protein
MKKNLSYSEFYKEFKLATGYYPEGVLRRDLSYADPVLQSVANDLLLCDRPTVESGIRIDNLGCEEPDYPSIVDVRYAIAAGIVNSLNISNQSLSRMFTEDQLGAWTTRVAKAIPESRRWRVLNTITENKRFLITYYNGQIADLTTDEISKINLLEDDSIGWIATYGVDERLQGNKTYIEAFQNFVNQIGILDFKKYHPNLHLPPSMFNDPDANAAVPVTDIEVIQYAREMGVSPESITLSAKKLHTLVLEKMVNSFVPIFYQLDDVLDMYYATYNMIEANSVARLCLTIPEVRKGILEGTEKGKIFEHYVYSLLTGSERVLVILDEDHEIPVGMLRTRENEPRGKQDKVVTYSYIKPTSNEGFRVSISRRNNSQFGLVLDAIGKEETDIDILLVHHAQPKHILIGECKYTVIYKDSYYEKGIVSTEKLAGAISGSPEVRKALGLPLDYQIIPVIFVSHTGELSKDISKSLKVPMHLLLSGAFERMIADYIGRGGSQSMP